MKLGPRAQAAGYRLVHLDETPSTNDEARALAEAGDGGRHWVTAGLQKAGRGRHGRVWSSPPGNLYASLLLVEPCERRAAAQLGFVAGLALHDAVADVTGIGAPRLALKWPNDLLLDGAKVSGLLMEGVVAARDTFAVVIGIGLNVTEAPAGTPYPAAALSMVAPGLTPQHVFPHLADAMVARLETWQGARNFVDIRAAWLARAAGIGANVTLRLPSGEKAGRFHGLDVDGRLELAHNGSIERIDAGDLFFGAAGAPSVT